ncbi:hypothetical protein C0991_002575 [Blastosporella zonata]|nr:hypothetical protein C0991_002575 [Blastosporella zonata]
MSEWIDVKEDSVSLFLPSDSSGAETGIYLTAAEGHPGISLPPDPEHVFQGRPAATPSERQRTVQACDKCRERKTKVRQQMFDMVIALRFISSAQASTQFVKDVPPEG